jgi:hypothetical protein
VLDAVLRQADATGYDGYFLSISEHFMTLLAARAERFVMAMLQCVKPYDVGIRRCTIMRGFFS